MSRGFQNIRVVQFQHVYQENIRRKQRILYMGRLRCPNIIEPMATDTIWGIVICVTAPLRLMYFYAVRPRKKGCPRCPFSLCLTGHSLNKMLRAKRHSIVWSLTERKYNQDIVAFRFGLDLFDWAKSFSAGCTKW